MSLLLDSHVVLWWLADDQTLTQAIKDRLDHDPNIFVSAVTVWEIIIKQANGKLFAPVDLVDRIVESGFTPLPVSFDHAVTAGRLPPIHRDPFDRMLVAQARCESLAPATRDVHCQKYDVDLLVV